MNILVALLLTILHHTTSKDSSTVNWSSIPNSIEKSCIILLPRKLKNGTDEITSLYIDDAPVYIYDEESISQLKSVTDLEISFKLNENSVSLDSLHKLNPKKVIVIERKKIDYKCLLPIPRKKISLNAYISSDKEQNIDNLIDWINDHCFLFRQRSSSEVNSKGLHRQYIRNYVYHSPMKLEDDSKDDVHCEERFDMPNSLQFFSNYVQHSKPVIFRNAAKDWPAMTKWSNEFFEENYGSHKIHVKLAPNGEFEGVESVNKWEEFLEGKFSIPTQVLAKLKFPDLVVVRPATLDIKFSEFLQYISNQSSVLDNVSAYLEYTSLGEIGEELILRDIKNPKIAEQLTTRSTNIWLSDGRTLGKLHFDPFENLLCQLSGSKDLQLFDPHDNRRLYEGHIPEALLTYNQTTKEFHRRKLLDSTSMVMSPIDIRKPDMKRFPLFAPLRPLKCRINPGDVLYLPAFWWHEVQSSPDITEKRNLAVNFWYEPFLTKDHPCDTCPLDVNPHYTHLL